MTGSDLWAIALPIFAVAEIPPVVRARLLLAGLIVLILGSFLIGLVIILGRWARRRVQRNPSKPSAPVGDDWYQKPLVPPEDESHV